MNLSIHPAHPSLHPLTPDIPPYIPPFYETAQPSHFHPFLHKNIYILILIELSTYFCTHLSENPSNHLTIPPPRNCRPSTSSYIILLISSPHPSIHHSNHLSIEPSSHHFIHPKTCISQFNQPIPPFNSIFPQTIDQYPIYLFTHSSTQLNTSLHPSLYPSLPPVVQPTCFKLHTSIQASAHTSIHLSTHSSIQLLTCLRRIVRQSLHPTVTHSFIDFLCTHFYVQPSTKPS